MCVRANYVKQKYTKGVIRKLLRDLGVSMLNRSISWKHAHYLMTNMFTKEGFTRLRYDNATSHEPNPEDIEEVWRHCKTITDAAGGRLAPHPQRALSGLLTKNHMALGLQCVDHGGTPWDNDNTPMKAPPRGQNTVELYESLSDGIFVEELRYAAVVEDMDAVRFISLADNMDQAKSMPEHEAEYLLRTWQTSQRVKPSLGKTHWEAVEEVMSVATAGAWTRSHLVFVYNFAKGLGDEHMRAIRLFHFFHVNATVLRIEVDFFGVLADAALPPWVAVALLVCQYMTDPNTKGGYISTGTGVIAKGVHKSHVQKIAEEPERAKVCQQLIQHYLDDLYTEDLNAAVNSTVGAFLCKVGRLLLATQDLQDKEGQKKLAKMEVQLRQTLSSDVQLPEGLVMSGSQAVIDSMAADRKDKGKDKKKTEGPSAIPTLGPHAEFQQDGSAVRNAEVRAGEEGMCLGTEVRWRRRSANVEEGTTGKIVGFTRGMVRVRVQRDDDTATVTVALGALGLVGENDEETDDHAEDTDDKKEEEGEPPAILDWELSTDDDSRGVYSANVVVALFQLNAAKGSDNQIVSCDSKGCVTAARDVKAREITLVPVSQEVTTAATKGRDYVTAHVSLRSSAESQVYINGPEDIASESPKPFWLARNQSIGEAAESANLDTYIVEVGAPSSLTIKDPAYKAACKTAPIKMRIPIMSNPDRIEAGDRLIVKMKGRKRKAEADAD